MAGGKDWGFETNDSKGDFGRITQIMAKNFARAHRNYVTYFEKDDHTPGDLGWFYNERSNIGFLAAAAWMVPSWIAIEEFALEKKRGREKRNGRADIYIGATLDTRRKFCDMAIEAKQAWPRSEKGLKSALDIHNSHSALARACADAKESLSRRYVAYRCGAVFITPQINSSNEQVARKRRVDIFESFWEMCEGLTNPTWSAFSFVSPHLEQNWPSKERKQRFSYPAVGVILVVV